MTSIGPFPMHAVLVIVVALLARWLVLALARRMGGAVYSAAPKRAGALFTDAFFVGLLVARLGYVLRWWSEYAAAPWSIVAIGDGGFLWWTGLPAALAFVGWCTRKHPSLRKPLVIGIGTGLLAWFALASALALLQRSAPPIPAITGAKLDGASVKLAPSAGKPVLLNLWATWCPPCRREMPVFVDALQRYPDVDIVLLNQGEDADTIRAFLEQQQLRLHDHVLLDPQSQAMPTSHTRGLPTTLFFDADGRLVTSYMGELTRASLADTLHKHFDARSATPSPPRNEHNLAEPLLSRPTRRASAVGERVPRRRRLLG
ncbi:TlpA disulfide reductase family protein [Pseudoxanthomonas sp. Root630]|uniref:TlpA disulfide reductase family protein n=1 Tax=Pseudoxanthomonas sp. Root630 TaxID=1736574 RepID=UPI0009D6C02B|nr:TlpA disulfide reductase family protein [Pseudoxanthomonas sp. Root630]